jgi:hypothetical protein
MDAGRIIYASGPQFGEPRIKLLTVLSIKLIFWHVAPTTSVDTLLHVNLRFFSSG